MDISKELEKFILAELTIDQDKKSIARDEDLISQGFIDSLGILKLAAFIDEKFGVQVTDLDMVPENFQNLENLTAFINSRR
jgi:acyl carrier protein